MHVSNLFLLLGLAATTIYADNSVTEFDGDNCSGKPKDTSYPNGIELNVSPSTKSFKLHIDPDKRKYWRWVANGLECGSESTQEEREAGLGLEAWYAYEKAEKDHTITDESCFLTQVKKARGDGFMWGDSGMKCLRLIIFNDPDYPYPRPKDVKVFEA